ncbi:MAG: hypothetical protein COB26_10235 [Piscirickettsiaceae bacterium]|nr:MAG: hypothetical protein COB26_10235 [Piscirickettsiaceae bacterium]
MVRKIFYIGLFGIIYGVSYWYLYRHWGLAGAAVLLGVCSLFYFGFYEFIKTNERKWQQYLMV